MRQLHHFYSTTSTPPLGSVPAKPLKILRPDKPREAESFEREIKRIKDAIAGSYGPAFYDRGTLGGCLFVVMQFADPVPTNLGVREALPFIDAIAEALTTLAENGFCHGDVKWRNMGLLNGLPGLLDLGSVRPLIPDDQREDITYTPGLAPPELIANGFAAPWIDVYGFATALNEILDDEAKEVYAPAIRAGMDLRPEQRLESAQDLKLASHECYEKSCRQKLRARLIHAGALVLTAVLSAGITLRLVANANKERWNKVVNHHICLEVDSQMRAGRFLFEENNTVDARKCFLKAAELGEEARKILRLMDEIAISDRLNSVSEP